MKLSKYRNIIVSFVCGALVATAGAAFADQAVTASIMSSIHFTFNGADQTLPDGYVGLNYGGHVYVPARFVAENMGGAVTWDSSTNTVGITSGGQTSGGGSSTGSSSSSGQTVGNYTFSNFNMQTDEYTTKVIGEIVNNSTDSHNVNITVNMYDAKGNLLGTAAGVVLDLGPGQKKSFEADSESPITGVATYSFQIDGEW